MKKFEFIKKMLELGAELDKCDNHIQCTMIANDANILYDEHFKELKD